MAILSDGQVVHDLTLPGCECCPNCGNLTLNSGESVDVGVGQVQCSPDFCEFCGYVQPGLYTANQYTYQQFAKLWELQIDPWAREEQADV